MIHYIQCSVMAKITVSDCESAHEWVQKLADESEPDELYPERYDWYEVRRVVLQLKEQFSPSRDDTELARRYQTLRTETTLSNREAEVVALKELGLTHNAISTYYAVIAEGTTGDEQYPQSVSTVDEYSRRASQKYKTAQRTLDELEPTYGN